MCIDGGTNQECWMRAEHGLGVFIHLHWSSNTWTDTKYEGTVTISNTKFVSNAASLANTMQILTSWSILSNTLVVDLGTGGIYV